MTEEQKRKLTAQRREFPETMELLAKVREALAEQVFKTPVLAADQREALCLRVQTLDAMMDEMRKIMAAGASQEAIDEYAKSFATTETR